MGDRKLVCNIPFIITWISRGRARRTVDDFERVFEDGGEGEGMIEAAVLYFAVKSGVPAGDRGLNCAYVAVINQCRCHRKFVVPTHCTFGVSKLQIFRSRAEQRRVLFVLAVCLGSVVVECEG